MTARSWLDGDYGALAAQRLLDAAGGLFAERGVADVGMADVAAAAGCSRATLYRYFASRKELRTAFVHREARRVGAAVAEELHGIADPEERTLAGAQAAIRRVRLDATLAGWFRDEASGIAISMAQSSPVIDAIVGGFLGDSADPQVQRRARWLVRVIVSLLAMPGTDPDDERACSNGSYTPSSRTRSPASAAAGQPMRPLRPSVFDPYDPAVLDEPYEAYRWLRDNDPVHLYAGPQRRRRLLRAVPVRGHLGGGSRHRDVLLRTRHHLSQRVRGAGPGADHRDARPARAHQAAGADRVGVHAAPRRPARERAARASSVGASR